MPCPSGARACREPERLNAELEKLFLERTQDEYRNPTPSHIPQDETFESRFNLFRWPESCVQELRRFVLDGVLQTVLEATSLSPEAVSRLKLHNHTWFHVSRYAGSFVAHNHPVASWSAVYCVRGGEEVPQHPQSGVLRFFDPRYGADAYVDPANARLRPQFAHRPLELRLQAGELVVFPSYVFHEVAPFFGQRHPHHRRQQLLVHLISRATVACGGCCICATGGRDHGSSAVQNPQNPCTDAASAHQIAFAVPFHPCSISAITAPTGPCAVHNSCFKGREPE